MKISIAIRRALQAVVSLALLAVVLMGSKANSYAQLPPRPTPGLPLRPPASPGAPSLTPQSLQPSTSQQTEAGAHIVLVLNTHSPGGEYWTEVEWEGLPGHWYRVDGWRTFTSQRSVTWFVGEADLRKGPFRWQVYDRPGGTAVASSERFFLPAWRGSMIVIPVALP